MKERKEEEREKEKEGKGKKEERRKAGKRKIQNTPTFQKAWI